MATILLVEDDNNLREIYEARLRAEGYDIVSAQDGEAALVVAKKTKPDLIISDVMMPRISGFEMLDILRNTEGLKDVKVIMLTALGQAEDKTRADKLGADRYLVKSQVTLEDIVKSASDLLISAGAITAPATAAAPAGTEAGAASSASAPTTAPAPTTPPVASAIVPVAVAPEPPAPAPTSEPPTAAVPPAPVPEPPAPVTPPAPEPPQPTTTTPPPQPAPPAPAVKPVPEDDSVTIAKKRIIQPIAAGEAPQPSNLDDLLAKEGMNPFGTNQTVADNHTDSDLLHPPGHVISPNPANAAGKPVDPNSIAL